MKAMELRPIFLVGFMASGKSRVGRALAAHLGVGFEDTDAQIEADAGRTIAALFAEDGEACFRAFEHAALSRLLERVKAPCVVATGGGLFVEPENRELVNRRGVSLWLDAPDDVVLRRLAASGNRPL